MDSKSTDKDQKIKDTRGFWEYNHFQKFCDITNECNIKKNSVLSVVLIQVKFLICLTLHCQKNKLFKIKLIGE